MTSAADPPLVLIAAVARNGVIGNGNALPWRLPSDLRHFKAATMGKPVLMGRKTFQSLGGPLPGRSIIVVSRDSGPDLPGVWRTATLEEALARGRDLARELGASDLMVAGGGTLYRALMDRAHALMITEVDLAPEGDTRFPVIDPAVWREASRLVGAPTERDGAAFSFVTYSRK